MGMYASYYAINQTQANEYKALLKVEYEDNIEKFFDNLEVIDNNLETIYHDLSHEDFIELYKLWDGLHFLLTGFNSNDDYNSQKTAG